MDGTNGTGSVLGAAATIVSTTFGTFIISRTAALGYVKLIAYMSYALLTAVLISFIIKKLASRKAQKR
jgi:hypothetical protein